MKERLVITLMEHSLWGFLLQPTLVEELSSGSLAILEIVDSHSTSFNRMDDKTKELIRFAESFSDKMLMKNYSKAKTVADFHKQIKEDTIQRFILPLIEKYQHKMIARIQELSLPIYFREAVKMRTLYDTDKVQVSKEPAQVLLNFVSQEDGSIHYFIQVRWERRLVNLTNKEYGVICNEPAVVCVDNSLFVFESLDAKKLLPFFEKGHVLVPAASRKVYIEKFVAGCIRDYEVKTSGLDIVEIVPEKKARLSLLSGWNEVPIVELLFDYDGIGYPPAKPGKKTVKTVSRDKDVGIEWFQPDMDWEQQKRSLLLQAGLSEWNNNTFQIEKTDSDSNLIHVYITWLQNHPEILSEFEITHTIGEKVYYVGQIHLQEQIEEKQDWFDIRTVVSIGSFQIPFLKFKNHLIQGIREYILPDNSVFVIPEEWFSRYQEIMLLGKKTGETLRLQKSQHFLLDDIGFDTKKCVQEVAEEKITVPKEIKASLRPYQQKGFSWLVYLYRNNYGGCLGDDMGLGKTLQTICLLQYIANMKREKKHSKDDNRLFVELPLFSGNAGDADDKSFPPSLVVLPSSLIHNWVNELKKFAPSLKVYAYSGIKRMKTKDIGKFFSMFDVVLTTYGTLRVDIDLLKTAEFHHLIMDESQYVRNPDSMSFKAIKQIQARYKLALTGTLIENSLNDLWAQFDIVNEGMLGTFSSFKKAYIHPINQGNQEKQERLLKLIHPFIMRRTKEEVAPELPPVTEEVVYCDMTEDQKSLYEKEKSRIRNSLSVDSLQESIAANFAFVTLQGLTRLRLLANHPALLDEKYEGDSGKFEQVMMSLEELIEKKHKVLVFSSFVKHLKLFKDYLDKHKHKYSWLTGDTPIPAREKEIARFQENKDVNCFFISLKAGGVGLNLTAADYVFILDPWWNPSAEMQALSRSHRIGQNKNVMVYRFISNDTIEEKIRRLQECKSRLAETFVSSSNPLTGMTKEEIEGLLD